MTRRVRPDARWVRAAITFDLGRAGAWGLFLDSGRAAVTGKPSGEPDLTIYTSPETLRDIATRRRPGYEAFLDGDLSVRGNLSLALQLESLFLPAVDAPPGYAHTYHLKVGRLRWSILEVGPPDELPVFLFHGLGATKATFLPTARALSKHYRVLNCDMLGFGDSAKPIATYDAPWFADRVLELMNALGIARAGFVGNSMGGRIALEVGLVAPERCHALVLLCPAMAFLRFRQLAPFIRVLRPELGVLPVRPTRGMALQTMRACFADPSRLPDFWYEAAVDEFFRVFSKTRGRLAFYAAARHIYLDEPHGEAGFWQRLRTLEVPSQFVFGREDVLIPSSFAHYVAEALPEARIALIDDCGHVPQLERPDDTNRLARSVLETEPSAEEGSRRMAGS